uniref:Solute carrier family 25 member 40 n=1 Tax=Enterobius vermicularis TaxID=51028 RepID=A0A0N4UVI8_ENTVE
MRTHDEEPCSSGSVTLMQQVFAATSGAIITSLTMTPMDVVKIRLQQQQHPFVKGTCFLYHNGLMDHLCTACAESNGKDPCEWFLRPGNFTGTWDAFVKISKTEGVTSLWSGLSPTLVMAVPATVLYYAAYDNMLLRLKKRYKQNSFWLPLIAGIGARTMATTVVSPLEMIRTKMQSEKLTYYEIGEAVRRSKSLDGWLSFWRGWGPTIMRDLPFSAVYWSIYEYLKVKAIRKFEKGLTVWISFFCGAISGTIAALVTTPFDVVKTHRQVTFGEVQQILNFKNKVSSGLAFLVIKPEDMKTNTRISKLRELKNNDLPSNAKIESKSTFGIFKEIVHKRGLRALFAGAIPRVVKISPACAIMISCYEYAKMYFTKRNRQRTKSFSSIDWDHVEDYN